MYFQRRNLPTTFASALAMTENLLHQDDDRNLTPDQKTEEYERLIAFQQIAVASSFEDCLIVYHLENLNKKQINILRLIYRSTRPWMLGHVVGILLDKLDGNMTNKDFAESVRTIVEQLTKPETAGESRKLKGLVVKLAKES